MTTAIRAILELADDAPGKAIAQMPEDFAHGIHESILKAMPERLRLLETGLAEL